MSDEPQPEETALVQQIAGETSATLECRTADPELRANAERLVFLLRLNDALRPLSDPGAVQETASKLLAEHLAVTRVGYAEVEDGGYSVHREYARGVLPLVGESPVLVGAQLLEAFRRGETVVVSDVGTDPRLTDEERASMKSRQIHAFVGTALFKEGQMVAAFGANHEVPRDWTATEAELVRDVAERTWDAVERTRVEAALRRQEHRLRLALDASAGGSWTWIAATNQVDWDDRFRALYGFAPDHPATTDAWQPLIHEEDRPQVLGLLNEILTSKTKDSWENTFRIVKPDGTVAWIQSRGRADRDAHGNVTRLTGLDLDFNTRRRTEEVQQAQRDEEHERALRTLLETATQGIVSVDAHGSIVTANDAFEAMFGWGAGELIGQSIERLLPSVSRDAHARQRGNYFGAPRARLMGGGLQLVGERKDGSTFPIEVSLNHVDTPDGPRAFAFVTDITERQRAASALQERTAELEHRTTQLRRMASDLTLAEQHAREQIAKTLHDGLQQLLVIAALNLDQQLNRDTERGMAPSDLISEAKHQLDQAIAAARSLNFELYPPVLQYSGLPRALTWLADWTRDRYKLDVRVIIDPQADSPRKDVRTLLFESVRELLFNAVKHAQTDRVTLELALGAGDHLCITVVDQGIGFDRAGLDERSKAGQVGWGLFSIRERLTLLGGSFEISSTPGKGTWVRLIAPRGTAQRTGASKASTVASIGMAPPRHTSDSPPSPLRILVVDDHATVRSTLREILHQRPQLTVVGDAADGLEAIALAHRLRPDVILMDIAMPHMDGIEATMRIRAELPDTVIFGLSMQPRSDIAHTLAQAGARGYFVKGVDTQRLIEQLLALHASPRTRGRMG